MVNTIIKLPDGRVGTICWNRLDGTGGVWGEHVFETIDGGFGDLPEPEFMLREKSIEDRFRKTGHRHDIECVGTEFEILKIGSAAGAAYMGEKMPSEYAKKTAINAWLTPATEDIPINPHLLIEVAHLIDAEIDWHRRVWAAHVEITGVPADLLPDRRKT